MPELPPHDAPSRALASMSSEPKPQPLCPGWVRGMLLLLLAMPAFALDPVASTVYVMTVLVLVWRALDLVDDGPPPEDASSGAR